MATNNTLFLKGDSRCVLLLHGYVGSTQEVGRTARALHKAGYTVYSFNLAGHGTEAVGDLFEFHPNTWIQQVDEAINFLENEGFKDIAIMGLSLGGILALNATLKYPNRFKAIGTFNSPCIDGLESTPIRDYIMHGVRHILTHRKWENDDIRKEINSLTPQMEKQIKEIDTLITHVRQHLPDIITPVYIAKSDQDELIKPSSQDALASRLVNTNVQLDSFDNGKHVISTSPAFKNFQIKLIEYLNSLKWT